MPDVFDLTPGQMAAACHMTPKACEPWIEPVTASWRRFEVNSRVRQAAWLAQMSHESARFTRLEENLNYRAARLLEVFPWRRWRTWGFRDLADANRYAGKPYEIAERIYGGRIGNGPAGSGDGWAFRGAGPLQITGRINHEEMAAFFGMPLEEFSAWARTPAGGCMAGSRFWWATKCNELADLGKFKTITLRINGGTNGLQDRITLHKSAKAALGVE